MRATIILAVGLSIGCGLALPCAVRADQAAGSSAQVITDQVSSDQAPDGQAISGTQTAVTGTGEDATNLLRHRLVQSESEKRVFRMRLWASLLQGDMKEIHRIYGYPSTRYREEVLGRLTERWTYFANGKQFIFENSKLVKTLELNPGSPWIDEAHRSSLILSP